MRTIKRNILLNPGPATTTDSVKFAQVVPDICPREAEFGDQLDFVSSELTRLAAAAPDDYAAVLFGGSGTAAVEAILSSVVGDGLAVIVNNGAYGRRMCEIASAYGMSYLEFTSPPDEPLVLHVLECFVADCSRKVTHLAVVHHETTTGLLNDIEGIGELCRRLEIDMLVDAVSSFGAVPVEMGSMNIRFLASSSNKNIQGMPGLSFVIADKNRLESLGHIKPRNYYLNLYEQYRSLRDTRQMRFTPPVQTIYALKQAIEELKREGIRERYARYVKSWETLTTGIARLGLRHLVDARHHGKMVTAIVEPDCRGYDFAQMHDYFYAQGFTIYPGKLGMTTFRIANIGAITYEDMKAFLELLGRHLRSIGHTGNASIRKSGELPSNQEKI